MIRSVTAFIALVGFLGIASPCAFADGAYNIAYATPNYQPAPVLCPQNPYRIYYNPIRYASAYAAVSVTETPPPEFGSLPAAVANAASSFAKKNKIGTFGSSTPPLDPKTIAPLTKTILFELQNEINREQQKLTSLLDTTVSDQGSLNTLQDQVNLAYNDLSAVSIAGVSFPADQTTTPIDWTKPAPATTLLNYVAEFYRWLVNVAAPNVPSGDQDVVTSAENQVSTSGTVYQAAYLIDGTFVSLLGRARLTNKTSGAPDLDAQAYYVTSGATPGYQVYGLHTVHQFAATDLESELKTLVANQNPTATPNPTTHPGPTPPKEAALSRSFRLHAIHNSNGEQQVSLALSDRAPRSDSGSPANGGPESGAPQNGSGSSSGVLYTVAIVDCPSLLTKSAGIGFGWLPYRSWQLGTTKQNAKTLYQIQPQNSQGGRFNYASALMSYRIFGLGSEADIHVTVGATSMTASTTYLAGLSLMFSRAMMITGGFVGGTIQTLNSYEVGQVVPKSTALKTTASTVMRPAIMITFPFLDNKKEAPQSKGHPKDNP